MRPVSEENTNVGFLSLDTAAGVLTNAVSRMRNETAVVSALSLPLMSLPRTRNVCSPSGSVTVC